MIRVHKYCKKIGIFAGVVFSAAFLAGCGDEKVDTVKVQFEKDINAFCDNIVLIDTSINEITNVSGDEEGLEAAKAELLDCLDELDDEFMKFAKMDFPEEYDYLEKMSDEASEYMTEAVSSYHKLYGLKDGYSVTMKEYADENYARAYKRVRIITALLRGETPDEEGLTVQ